MTSKEVLLQQLITGLSNGMIIALIALGYTMVYGIIELINFAHGDLFMLGSFFALTLVGAFGLDTVSGGAGGYAAVAAIMFASAIFCAGCNWTIDRLAYKPLRKAPKLTPLVSAIGVSFILMNIGLFWGGLPMDVFSAGRAATAPKNFPNLIPNGNMLGEGSVIQFTAKDLMVFVATIPLVTALTIFVKYTKMGKAMRAVAQNPTAAQLMGIDTDRVIGLTFVIGGALA
ncbi:branched-chain amino acid ABC transporter permease, partial [Candidatus Sumerlaeota bacterium]|nr:branched-chain amino acid ABC transporter permease [Candidatus Sumerlaeota bacterium]